MAKKLTQEEIYNLYDNLFNYDITHYKNNKSLIDIMCKKCNKQFNRSIDSHKRSNGVCPHCKKQQKIQIMIDEFNIIHHSKYDYMQMDYTNHKTKINIGCKIHGVFAQTPSSHKQGAGCPDCKNEKLRLSPKKVIYDFLLIHNGDYDYSEMSYINARTKIKIKCNKCSVSFLQTPNDHKNGHGCPNCGSVRMLHNKHTYKNRPTTLYYIQVGNLYKIGLTMTEVKTRFIKEINNGLSIKLIQSWFFEDGAIAYEREQTILNRFKDNRYIGPNILYGGNTELFVCDVLKLNI